MLSALAVAVFLPMLIICDRGPDLAAASSADRATVTGELLRVGGPAPGDSVPLSGTVALRSQQMAITVEVDASGMFTVSVPSGQYRVNGELPCPASKDVDTDLRVVSHVQVVCHVR
jgi:hypothetical protein